MPPSAPKLRALGPADAQPVAATLAAAFEGYPLTEWTVLRDGRGIQRAELYFASFFEKALATGFATGSADLRAAALWAPPGSHRLPWPLQLRLFSRLPRICGLRRLPSRLRVFAKLAAHHPDEPHYTLDVLGTHPDHRGRGLASSLLAEGLARADAAHVGAYLLTSSEEAVAFYERRDFAVKEELRLLDDGPRIWAMWRPAAT